MREKVCLLMNQAGGGGAPTVLPPAGRPLSDCTEMIVGFANTIRFLMSTVTREKYIQADIMIKPFLSRIDKI
jgi:hypothetical protein